MKKALRSHSLVLWFAKNLGLRCLRYLLQEILPEYPGLRIEQLYLSQRDEACFALAKLAASHSIPCTIIPDSDRSDQQGVHQFLRQSFENVHADLGLIIGFPHRLPAEVIAGCGHGIINLHFAPLPKYRGSGTLVHAIANQEQEYGVTFHYIDAQLDTGPVIAVTTIPLDPARDISELILEFEDLAFYFFVEYIEHFLTEKIPATSQETLCREQQITPILCTRASTKKMLLRAQTFHLGK